MNRHSKLSNNCSLRNPRAHSPFMPSFSPGVGTSFQGLRWTLQGAGATNVEGPALTELSLGGQDMAGKGLRVCSVSSRWRWGLGSFQKPLL